MKVVLFNGGSQSEFSSIDKIDQYGDEIVVLDGVTHTDVESFRVVSE